MKRCAHIVGFENRHHGGGIELIRCGFPLRTMGNDTSLLACPNCGAIWDALADNLGMPRAALDASNKQ